MKLLLHACCGPCSLEPVRLLQEAGHELTIAYMNSNIHPKEEYAHRRDTLLAWAKEHELPVAEGIYSPQAWEKSAGAIATKFPHQRSERCRACYRLRFEEAVSYAVDHHFEGICTTLSVSPYQYSDIIQEELESLGSKAGLQVIFEDFRPFYQEATRRSRELGMYRQNYCGCKISNIEAAEEREQRKRARKAEKERLKALKHSQKETEASIEAKATKLEQATQTPTAKMPQTNEKSSRENF